MSRAATDRTSSKVALPGADAAARLLVVGSCNIDLAARTARLPLAGETLLAQEFTQRTGGKGANQAIAAARLGASVALVSAVGDDAFGALILERLISEGVDVTHVRRLAGERSGIALIVTDAAGENTIVVSPGAGGRVSVDGCELERAPAVLTQLEIPLEVVCEAASRAHGMFVLNASPFRPLPPSLVERCDVVVVNQSEYELGQAVLDQAKLTCVTLGALGAKLLDHGNEMAAVQSPAVAAIDTVGAGDAFVAALCVELERGSDPAAALELACRAGALATTRDGAQAALPNREELLWSTSAS